MGLGGVEAFLHDRVLSGSGRRPWAQSMRGYCVQAQGTWGHKDIERLETGGFSLETAWKQAGRGRRKPGSETGCRGKGMVK